MIYFAVMPVRRMTADQLFDSLVQATGFYEPPAPRAQQPFAMDSARADFRNKFAEDTAAGVETQTSIVQALALMNGKLTSDATNVEDSKTLAAVVAAPFLDTSSRLDTLFLASLGRHATSEETARFTAYIATGPEDKRLADVFWALLNSAEFALNH